MSAARTRLPRGEGDRLRDEILDAVGALLDETQDEAAVSIRAIAERVGVSPPSIYRHFADKEALLGAVCASVFAELQYGVADAVAAADDPIDAMARAARCYVEFGLAHPEHYRLVFMRSLDHAMPVSKDELVNGLDEEAERAAEALFGGDALAGSQAFKALHDLMNDALQLFPEAGRPDPFVMTTTMWMAMHGITSLRITKPDFSWPDLDEQIDLVIWPWRQYLATLA